MFYVFHERGKEEKAYGDFLSLDPVSEIVAGLIFFLSSSQFSLTANFSSPFQEPQEDAFQQELPDPRPEGEAGKVRGGKGGGGGVNIVMSKKSEKGVNKTCLKRLVDLIDSIFSVKRFK